MRSFEVVGADYYSTTTPSQHIPSHYWCLRSKSGKGMRKEKKALHLFSLVLSAYLQQLFLIVLFRSNSSKNGNQLRRELWRSCGEVASKGKETLISDHTAKGTVCSIRYSIGEAASNACASCADRANQGCDSFPHCVWAYSGRTNCRRSTRKVNKKSTCIKLLLLSMLSIGLSPPPAKLWQRS